MAIHDFGLFVAASLALNLTPGNDMVYVMSRSMGQGTRAGVVSALGIMGGCLVHITAAVIGLSALIAQSAVAFNIIRYAGAAYLVYLGIQSLIKQRTQWRPERESHRQPLRRLFWQGVVTNALNPKVALFFLAFLPQFVDYTSAGVPGQILLLGAWFATQGTVVNVLVAVLFGRISRWLGHSAAWLRWQQRITGILLIGLGIRVALQVKR